MTESVAQPLSLHFMSMNVKAIRKMPSQDSSSGREKKKGGGFLMRAAKSKKEDVTEEQLLKKDTITPQDIVRLDKITESELQLFFALRNTIGLDGQYFISIILLVIENPGPRFSSSVIVFFG